MDFPALTACAEIRRGVLPVAAIGAACGWDKASMSATGKALGERSGMVRREKAERARNNLAAAQTAYWNN